MSKSLILAKSKAAAYQTVDEFQILRALAVAVASPELRTSLVGGESLHATILVHLREVEGTVETARQVRYINIESELLVEEVEHLVVAGVLHQVYAGSNVAAACAFGDKAELDGVARSRDTVRARVIGAVDSAVSRAAFGIRTDGSVPGVTGVAVGITGGCVKPSPVGIEHDGLGGRGTATGLCALGDLEGRVGLGSVGAGLLAVHERKRGK